ncbi:hypothetical protein GBAR_LOCUS15115, partial [Geodia barretti]
KRCAALSTDSPVFWSPNRDSGCDVTFNYLFFCANILRACHAYILLHSLVILLLAACCGRFLMRACVILPNFCHTPFTRAETRWRPRLGTRAALFRTQKKWGTKRILKGNWNHLVTVDRFICLDRMSVSRRRWITRVQHIICFTLYAETYSIY